MTMAGKVYPIPRLDRPRTVTGEPPDQDTTEVYVWRWAGGTQRHVGCTGRWSHLITIDCEHASDIAFENEVPLGSLVSPAC